FLDGPVCPRIVLNTNDSGYGSLRYVLGCLTEGDTIQFLPSLAGQTIFVSSAILDIAKNSTLMCTLSPPIKLFSTIDGLIVIEPGITLEVNGMTITSGISNGNNGAAIENDGFVRLHDVIIIRNPLYPSGDHLVHNMPGSTLMLFGNCRLQMN
ncbi:MAG TPA: hypothetical protein VJ508_01285, partial [Saprospiraceae bacterium]|nr:hypothetical protein [Saprospiraceae bacterium]